MDGYKFQNFLDGDTSEPLVERSDSHGFFSDRVWGQALCITEFALNI